MFAVRRSGQKALKLLVNKSVTPTLYRTTRRFQHEHEEYVKRSKIGVYISLLLVSSAFGAWWYQFNKKEKAKKLAIQKEQKSSRDLKAEEKDDDETINLFTNEKTEEENVIIKYADHPLESENKFLEEQLNELKAHLEKYKQREKDFPNELEKAKEQKKKELIEKFNQFLQAEDEKFQKRLEEAKMKQEYDIIIKVHELNEIQKEELKQNHEEEIDEITNMLDNLYNELMEETKKKILQEQEKETLERAERIAQVTDKVVALEEMFKRYESNLNEIESLQKLAVAISGLEETLRSNGPFKPDLESIRNSRPNDEYIKVMLSSLPDDLALRGVYNLEQLKEQFEFVSKESLKAAYIPDDIGMVGHIFTRALSYLVIPESGKVGGQSTDAKIARAKFYLEKGDLKTAVEELEELDEKPRQVIQTWIENAKNRIIAETTLTGLQCHLTNLVLPHLPE